MNRPTLFVISGVIAATGLAGCDRQEAQKAAEEAKAVAEKVAQTTKEAAGKAAGKAAQGAKEAGAAAMEKGREVAGAASGKIRAIWDSAKEKFGTPEVDGALSEVATLFADAEAAIKDGASAEKLAELKAKWEKWYSGVKESMSKLSADKQEQLNEILAKLREQWESIVGGAVESESGN